MNMNILSVYFIFNVFLLIMSGYIFVKTSRDLMKQREYTIFKTFVIAFMTYVVINSIWTMQEYDIIQLPKGVFTVICFLSLSSVLFNCLCFYKFTMIYYGYSNKMKPLYEFFGVLPFLVTDLLALISIWTGWVFSVSDDINIIRGPIYHAFTACAGVYFGIILVCSIVSMFKTNSPQARKNCLTLFLLVIFLVSWIIIDDIFDGLTIIPIAIFGVIMVVFTTFQQTGINTDALTQMNNRRKAMEYLTSQLENVSGSSPIYLFIIDINSFKQINDNYGHVEGDNALIIVADAIKEVVSSYHGFGARYGGDEFIIAIKAQNYIFDSYEVIKNIDTIVKTKCFFYKKPYEINLSYGCTLCNDSTLTIEMYIKEADKLLYESKNRQKEGSLE